MSTPALASVHRVLPAKPYTSLQEYIHAGGGAGLTAARAVEPSVVLDELQASGLRGRGGAGFPTATKWRTIASYASTVLDTAIVVNAAEGEPGTFKDRSIIRSNPYAVLEGALIAARVLGSRSITIAIKQRFVEDIERLASAIAEIGAAGWNADVDISIVEGPAEYLFGEETGLLEVLAGRPPFPRIAPPWRRGVVEVVADGDISPQGDRDVEPESGGEIGGGADDGESGLSADVVMASADAGTDAPPVLVNNVETFANVPGIVAKGAAWFREIGTVDSPGSVVCTVTGGVRRPVVVEVALGVSLRDVIAMTDSGPAESRPVLAVLTGVSNGVLTADQLDTPISYETMNAAGSGLGSSGFIVVDELTDPVALAAGVSRFLAIESCGQCTPCKQDGLEIFGLLEGIRRGEGGDADLDEIQVRLDRITEGARCNLAAQHQIVVGSILAKFDGAIRRRLAAAPDTGAGEPVLIAELLDIEGEVATLDESFTLKQPDWSDSDTDSGQSPVDRLSEP